MFFLPYKMIGTHFNNYVRLKKMYTSYYVCLIPCSQDDEDYYDSRRSASRNRFEEDLEVEAQAEKRIMNAKRVLLVLMCSCNMFDSKT